MLKPQLDGRLRKDNDTTGKLVKLLTFYQICSLSKVTKKNQRMTRVNRVV